MNVIKNYFNKQRLLLLLVVVVFYGNTLKNGYSLDDSVVTEKGNVTTKGIKAIPKILTSYYVEGAEDFQFEYRPIVKISFAIEHELFGVNPGISHFFNLVIYLIGLYLLFSVLKLLFANYSEDIPFYCVMLFAMMPIHTEVVASIKNRDILLCFAFTMIGFKHVILFFESGFKKWISVIVSFASFYISFLCKFDILPYIAIIPVILFIKDKKHFLWALLFLLILVFCLYLFKHTKKVALGKGTAERLFHYFENPLYFVHGVKYRFIAAFNSLGFYINQCLLPFKFCCYYGTDTIPVLKLNAYGVFGILCAPLLMFGVIRSFVKKDYLLFVGLLIFCASSSMYLNFIVPTVGIVGDRFAFFSSLGIAIIIVALITRFLALKKISSINIKIIISVLVIIYATITIKRNNEWNTIYTLINADVNKYPDNVYVNYKMGMYIVKGIEKNGNNLTIDQKKIKFIEARKYLEKSVATDPDYANTRNYLAYILVYLLNDFSAALPHINRSLEFKETTELYYYKAICMREIKQKDSAEFYLLKCIEKDNKFFNAYSLLAYDYIANNKIQKSIDLYLSAIKKGVATVEIYNAIGKIYWDQKNNAEANKYYQKALALEPANQEATAMVKRTSK